MAPLTAQAWERFDAVHPAPTFFARPAWARALSAAFEHLDPMPLEVRVEGETVVVPAMRSSGRIGWRHLVAFPLGTYTVVLREDGTPAPQDVVVQAMEAIGSAFDAVELSLWPLAPQAAGARSWRTRAHGAAVIDLSEGAEAALKHVDGVSRRMAGQAARRGVTCSRSNDSSAVDEYYAILQEASQHWGLPRPPYPKRLLEALYAYGGSDVEVWFARREGEAIAGGIVLYGADEMFFWSAAMRRSFGNLRPSNALNIALIRAAAERGVRWYNLGSSEGLPGVERFKRDLGAVDVPYATLVHERPLYTLYTRLRAPRRERALGESTS